MTCVFRIEHDIPHDLIWLKGISLSNLVDLLWFEEVPDSYGSCAASQNLEREFID